jgi:hypothetical protein
VVIEDIFSIAQHPILQNLVQCEEYLEKLVGAQGKRVALGIVRNDFFVVDDGDSVEFFAASKECGAKSHDTQEHETCPSLQESAKLPPMTRWYAYLSKKSDYFWPRFLMASAAIFRFSS